MKQLSLNCLAGLFLSLTLLSPSGFAQTHTPRSITINTNCGGFYEYLPLGYDNGSDTYPLMIYLHGMGQLGDGSTSALASILQNGPPQYISQGAFPASFTVGGETFRFIIISPQFKQWPSPADVAAAVDYALANYRVDIRRVYVTGTSMGGGATWEYAGNNNNYARKIAAIVPVCGASTPDQARADVIARANLAVWATHNQDDPDVPAGNTIGYVNAINNSATPPNPLAKSTIFPVTGHDAWTTSYNPNWRENGLNVYEWMLQYQRSGTGGPLPVVLSAYKVTATGKEVIVSWVTNAEQNNSYFSIERSSDGVQFKGIGQVAGTNKPTGASYSFADKQPVTGSSFYRLSQTDLDGTTRYFDIRKIVTGAGTQNGLVVFPNPAGASVTLGVNHDAPGKLLVNIINAQGLRVQTASYQKTAGYWQQVLSVVGLAPGIYVVQVQGEAFEGTYRMIKQ
jgi:dienelactone hydrolase